MFEGLIGLIEKHASYGPALLDAAKSGQRLILNYHTHGGPTGYCVSIGVKKANPLAFLGQAEPMQELAHIKGVGKEEAQGRAMMTEFGAELMAHYGLKEAPLFYLNGSPGDVK